MVFCCCPFRNRDQFLANVPSVVFLLLMLIQGSIRGHNWRCSSMARISPAQGLLAPFAWSGLGMPLAGGQGTEITPGWPGSRQCVSGTCARPSCAWWVPRRSQLRPSYQRSKRIEGAECQITWWTCQGRGEGTEHTERRRNAQERLPLTATRELDLRRSPNGGRIAGPRRRAARMRLTKARAQLGSGQR
jgi:hypothetical protein